MTISVASAVTALTFFLCIVLFGVSEVIIYKYNFPRTMRIAMRLIVMIGIALLAASTPGQAHDHANPQLDGWYKSLESRKGPCCDGSDAVRLEDPDWRIAEDGSHYQVRLDGEWVDVPETALVQGENKAGKALVWPMHQDGKSIPRCFMPGSGA